MQKRFWFELCKIAILTLSLSSQLGFAADSAESSTTLLDTVPSISPIAPDKVLTCTGTSAQEPGQLYRWNYLFKMYNDYSFHISGVFKGPYANDFEEIKGIGVKMDPTHPLPVRLYQHTLGQKFYLGTLLATSSLKTAEIKFAEGPSTLFECKLEDVLPR